MANLILDFYKNEDKYSDGNIEDYFLESLRNKLSSEEIIAKDKTWASYYHFSPNRRNLLDWIDFDQKNSVLEIGTGCGALTGFFLETFQEVTGIELSKRRASITQERYKEYVNLNIYVGDMKEVSIENKFDVVTSIGVLEYAQYIFDSEDSHLNFLKKCKEFLNKGGQLVLAIENKFGLKYWAGAREDHTGVYFDGVTGYRNAKVKTFSRNELIKLLEVAGFSEISFHYPYPDYKFCDQIFSDDYLPRVNQLNRENTPNYDSSRLALFNEVHVANELINSNMISDFMNSFLIIAK